MTKKIFKSNDKPGYCEGCEEWYKSFYMSSDPDKCIQCEAKLKTYHDRNGCYVYLSKADQRAKRKTYVTRHNWDASIETWTDEMEQNLEHYK